MKNIKEILKALTPEQCIEIAKIVKPNIYWNYIQSEDRWDGFDLIGGENMEDVEDTYEYIFQIDFRSEEIASRFRLYRNLNEYPIEGIELERIHDYLKTIEPIILSADDTEELLTLIRCYCDTDYSELKESHIIESVHEINLESILRLKGCEVKYETDPLEEGEDDNDFTWKTYTFYIKRNGKETIFKGVSSGVHGFKCHKELIIN